MKVCRDCNSKYPDTITQCQRCGSTNLAFMQNVQRPQQNNQNGGMQRPQQNNQNRQGQRPQNPQYNNMQRPQQNNMQRTQQNNMQRPQQNNQMNGMDRQYNNGQRQNQGMNNNMSSNNMQQYNYTDEIFDKNTKQTDIISIKEWIMMFLQLMIPIWNIIFIIKTLIGSKANETKKNYFKAYLIWLLISSIIGLILGFTISLMLEPLIKSIVPLLV